MLWIETMGQNRIRPALQGRDKEQGMQALGGAVLKRISRVKGKLTKTS
jgi:hypothetical protein